MWLVPASLRSAFVPESACWTKESELRSIISALPSEQWPMQSGKPLRPASLLLSWKRERWSQRLCGAAIFDASEQQTGAARWIASLPDSRAKTSASRASGPGSTASEAASSLTSSTLRMIAVRGASLWRTSAPSLLPPPPLWTRPKGNLKNVRPPESWENWPTAGGTRNGSLFPRPTWVPATGGQGGSASRGDGWATPDCNTSTYSNGKMGPNIREQASQWLTPNVPNGGRSVPAELVASKGTTEDGEKRTVGLESQSKYWTTPQAHDVTERGSGQQPTAKAGNACLARDARTWPTPASRDYRTPNSESLEARGGGMKGEQLPNFVEHHFSLPQAQPIPNGQESSPAGPGSPRRLNPAFGCWLMGWPCWWTNPGVTNCAKSAMESYRSRLGLRLSFLLDEQESST